MTAFRRITAEDRPRLEKFWREHWAGDEIAVHGEVFRPQDVEGFADDDWTAVVTYVVGPQGCEIISLDSVREGLGIGSQLIDAVAKEARRRGCRRLFLTTSNDNLHALGFYQRRGFELVRIRRGAISQAREQKPGIPLIGQNEIPIRDEIELEYPLHLNDSRAD